ncbi:hypothetical protein WDU94_000253 [Cyamophila willieti]
MVSKVCMFVTLFVAIVSLSTAFPAPKPHPGKDLDRQETAYFGSLGGYPAYGGGYGAGNYGGAYGYPGYGGYYGNSYPAPPGAGYGGASYSAGRVVTVNMATMVVSDTASTEFTDKILTLTLNPFHAI